MSGTVPRIVTKTIACLQVPTNGEIGQGSVLSRSLAKVNCDIDAESWLALAPATGCNGKRAVIDVGDESFEPIMNPADFVAQIDSQYLPCTPGATFVYDGESDDGELIGDTFDRGSRQCPLI